MDNNFKELADEKRDKNLTCPQCKKSNRDGKFSHFKGRPADEGKCFSCGYFVYRGNTNYTGTFNPKYNPIIDYNYIPTEVVNDMRIDIRFLADEPLVKYFRKYFRAEDVQKVLSRYHVGYDPQRGAIAFPYIDSNRRVRRLQYMKFKFDGYVCNRLNWTNWYDLKKKEDLRCLFGEHIINRFKDATIVVIESQRAAMFMTFDMINDPEPEEIYLATGGKSNLQSYLFERLEHRNIILMPDVDATELWTEQLEKLKLKHPTIDFHMDNTPFLNKDKIGNNGDIEDLMLFSSAHR